MSKALTSSQSFKNGLLTLGRTTQHLVHRLYCILMLDFNSQLIRLVVLLTAILVEF